MIRSEFYEAICRIPIKSDTLAYYEALAEVVESNQDKVPDWSLIADVLRDAALLASGEDLQLKKVEVNDKSAEDVKQLLRSLGFKIAYLKEKPEQKNVHDGTNISYDDSVYNTDISIILERGAAWMTEGDEEHLPFDEPATWGTISELISIGMEYE